MQTANSRSWVRMVLAFAAVMVVAGPSLVLAGGGNPSYVPKMSSLIGPATVANGGSANYVLHVTFTNGAICDFPPTTGATFTAVKGSITSGGAYTAPGTGNKDKVGGSFTQSNVTVTSVKVIQLQ